MVALDTAILELIIKNSLQAILIILYLAYELRLGRGKRFMDRLDNVSLVLLAVVEELDGVDTKKAYRRLGRDSAGYYKTSNYKSSEGDEEESDNED